MSLSDSDIPVVIYPVHKSKSEFRACPCRPRSGSELQLQTWCIELQLFVSAFKMPVHTKHRVLIHFCRKIFVLFVNIWNIRFITFSYFSMHYASLFQSSDLNYGHHLTNKEQTLSQAPIYYIRFIVYKLHKNLTQDITHFFHLIIEDPVCEKMHTVDIGTKLFFHTVQFKV